VLETALDAEMTEHLGYEKHDPVGAVAAIRMTAPGPRPVLTEIGPVIEVPRDTNSSFEPQIVKKRQRRLTGIDEIVGGGGVDHRDRHPLRRRVRDKIELVRGAGLRSALAYRAGVGDFAWTWAT
jgi:Transposase, Mutator family